MPVPGTAAPAISPHIPARFRYAQQGGVEAAGGALQESGKEEAPGVPGNSSEDFIFQRIDGVKCEIP